MSTRESELMHDGWTSLADILTTLVCSILFVGTVTWAMAKDGAAKTNLSLARLERLETHVKELDTEIEAVVSDIEQAQSLAARRAPASAPKR